MSHLKEIDMERHKDPLADLTPAELEVWNRYARAADQERKDRLEGRLPTRSEQAELDQLTRRPA